MPHPSRYAKMVSQMTALVTEEDSLPKDHPRIAEIAVEFAQLVKVAERMGRDFARCECRARQKWYR